MTAPNVDMQSSEMAVKVPSHFFFLDDATEWGGGILIRTSFLSFLFDNGFVLAQRVPLDATIAGFAVRPDMWPCFSLFLSFFIVHLFVLLPLRLKPQAKSRKPQAMMVVIVAMVEIARHLHQINNTAGLQSGRASSLPSAPLDCSCILSALSDETTSRASIALWLRL